MGTPYFKIIRVFDTFLKPIGKITIMLISSAFSVIFMFLYKAVLKYLNVNNWHQVNILNVFGKLIFFRSMFSRTLRGGYFL